MNGLSFSTSIPDAVASAQLGIAQGLAGFDRDAQVIAQSASGSLAGLPSALVDSLQQKLAVEASASVLRSSDQMVGALIDLWA